MWKAALSWLSWPPQTSDSNKVELDKNAFENVLDLEGDPSLLKQRLSASEINLYLIQAAAAGDATKVRDLILNDKACVSAVDKNGNTALHHAAHAGKTKAVHVLIDHGANLDQANNFNVTPRTLIENNPALKKAILDDDPHIATYLAILARAKFARENNPKPLEK